jgi:hypothetical protein
MALHQASMLSHNIKHLSNIITTLNLARHSLHLDIPDNMGIIVRSVSDNELHRACAIESLAYADNELNPILFPGPFPPDSQQKRVEQLIQTRKNDSTTTYLQAIDETSGRMIASAKWHVYRTPEEASKAARKLEFGPGTNKEACLAFFGGMGEKKKEIMGDRPHVCEFTLLSYHHKWRHPSVY